VKFDTLEPVVLDVDVPELHLPRRSLGTVVHVYRPQAFEVEFVSARGRTIALLTLKASQLRKATDADLVCVSRIGTGSDGKVTSQTPSRRTKRRG